jgi:hypothetical protein
LIYKPQVRNERKLPLEKFLPIILSKSNANFHLLPSASGPPTKVAGAKVNPITASTTRRSQHQLPQSPNPLGIKARAKENRRAESAARGANVQKTSWVSHWKAQMNNVFAGHST